MKTRSAFLLAGWVLGLVAGQAADLQAWTKMFNGRDLTGWKSNDEKPDVFTVADGIIKVSGGRAHLFFEGADGKANFKNFEFKAKVMTTPGSNSGIYFHTQFQAKDWPTKGFECQVNTSHTDVKKTGGLYGVLDVLNNAPSKDNEWFDYSIKVEGRHVVLQINGQTTADWTQPESWDPATALKNMSGRKLSEGTIALQGHDPKSTTYYKELFIRPLP
ncbi:MAG: DUF1080 domain-containing protein [Opitutus sp.]|nr:DUF1080 domain-containing protein [Opitutus sp.]